MGRSSMNAGNILVMTKNVLDEHNGQVPADLGAMTNFHGTMQQLTNAKKILKVGCLKSAGIV
eukprot:scaffold94521_cov79-Attheya_sp.AAC.2